MVVTFFSSANVSAFLTTTAKSSSALPTPHTGLYTWIICFAFKLGASPTNAKEEFQLLLQIHRYYKALLLS